MSYIDSLHLLVALLSRSVRGRAFKLGASVHAKGNNGSTTMLTTNIATSQHSLGICFGFNLSCRRNFIGKFAALAGLALVRGCESSSHLSARDDAYEYASSYLVTIV